jgi:hypothetical protein
LKDRPSNYFFGDMQAGYLALARGRRQEGNRRIIEADSRGRCSPRHASTLPSPPTLSLPIQMNEWENEQDSYL